jgi:hypothetical protein
MRRNRIDVSILTQQTIPAFGPDDRQEILRILSGRHKDPKPIGEPFRPGARIGHLLRMYPQLVPSPRAQGILRNIADLMKPTVKHSTTREDWRATVTEAKLAEWSHCSVRQVKREIRWLTKIGWPLIASTTGRRGRASEYRLVGDPFAFCEKQIRDAAIARARRHPAIVNDHVAAFKAIERGEITLEAAEAKAVAASRRRDWNLRVEPQTRLARD